MNINNIKYTFPQINTPYKINIKLEKTIKLFDNRIYSLRSKLKMSKFNDIGKINSYMKQYLCKYTKSLYSDDDILTLKFNDCIGTYMYILSYKYITKQKNKCLLLVENSNIIDAIYYLYTYILQIKPTFIVNIIGNNKTTKTQAIEEYCDKLNIKYEYVNMKNTEPTEFIIMDYIPYIPPFVNIRGIFQPYDTNNLVILALKRLVKGGSMIIFSTLITNIVNYQYYAYLSYFFEKITLGQLLSLPLIILGFFLFFFASRKKTLAPF